MEIERKFLVKALPNLENIRYKEILQAYICSTPVIRIRKIGDAYFLTVKGKGHIEREEFELPIDAKAFQHLLTKIEGHIIKKRRYYIPLDQSLTAELDIYFDQHEGLYTVEVEFSSKEEAMHFTPPDWFGMDVSLDYHYKNSYLSKNKI